MDLFYPLVRSLIVEKKSWLLSRLSPRSWQKVPREKSKETENLGHNKVFSGFVKSGFIGNHSCGSLCFPFNYFLKPGFPQRRSQNQKHRALNQSQLVPGVHPWRKIDRRKTGGGDCDVAFGASPTTVSEQSERLHYLKSLCSMAQFCQSRFHCPRPPWLISAPDQNRYATQATRKLKQRRF